VRYTLDDSPFAGRAGTGVTIAVLDSGIHSGHPHVGEVRHGMNFAGTREPTEWADRIGHGTAVAAAIREKSPGAELIAVRVFDRQLATNVEVLAEAIEWSADTGAHLINLSLGTANFANADRLARAIAHAASHGAIVISARQSNDVDWLPGSLDGVVGVIADATLEREMLDVIRRDDGAIMYAASPYPRPIPGVPRERNLFGVSFAVANVTGFLARALEATRCDAIATLQLLVP
jgi:subtilisin family serine protease